MTDNELQQKRLIAAAIDIGIGFVLSIGLWIVSFVLILVLHAVTRAGAAALYGERILHFGIALVMFGYVVGRDLLGGGRSLGKKTQDLKVVTASGGPIAAMDSFKRNAIFGIGAALGVVSATLRLVPCLGDAVACLITPLVLLGGLASVGAAVVEILKITQEPDGIRFGDQWAGTRVVR